VKTIGIVVVAALPLLVSDRRLRRSRHLTADQIGRQFR
jgi:hypothetical protein